MASMSKNNEYIEDFKKSISATVKSIGKNEQLEINYVKENPSINGNIYISSWSIPGKLNPTSTHSASAPATLII